MQMRLKMILNINPYDPKKVKLSPDENKAVYTLPQLPMGGQEWKTLKIYFLMDCLIDQPTNMASSRVACL